MFLLKIIILLCTRWSVWGTAPHKATPSFPFQNPNFRDRVPSLFRCNLHARAGSLRITVALLIRSTIFCFSCYVLCYDARIGDRLFKWLFLIPVTPRTCAVRLTPCTIPKYRKHLQLSSPNWR